MKKNKNNKSTNELGYKSGPLFGDLFEFHDYVIDMLNMRLRIFDIILKAILAEASRTREYEPLHTKKLEEKINVLNKHATYTIGKRSFFKLETENNIKSIVSCGRFSGHLQEVFFVDDFPYEKIVENIDRSKNAKNLVQKFKFILHLIKMDKSKRTSDLGEVVRSFVKDFSQSGLRIGCTPYMHFIGKHIVEQDKYEDLRAYDMQAVEKSNDLSRQYFSSSNRAKTPLNTMIQNPYRRLEMNFTDPKDRVALLNYSLKGTWDETDNEGDTHDISEVLSSTIPNCNQLHLSSFDDCEGQNESDGELDEKDLDWAPDYVTRNNYAIRRTENRWKSFRKN